MNTEKNQISQNRFQFQIFIGTILFVTIIGFVILGIDVMNLESKLKRIAHSKTTGINTEIYESAKGLPAAVENLREEVVYFVSAQLTNLREDETNHFAILHRITVVNDREYRHSREERFFKLPFPLEPHKYYQFFRLGTGKIARAEEYPPPTSPR